MSFPFRTLRLGGVEILICMASLLNIALVDSSSASAHRHVIDASDSWYKRYPQYPPYCSTPEEMETRRIPPLQIDKRLGETRLRHVTAILRHGARTPYMSGLNCWEDYNTNPETSVWDCNLTSYLSPPPPAEVATEEGNNNSQDEAMFLFEKRYDAFIDPDRNLSNYLKGTCQLGQLLLQGYEQEYTNGLFLRNAYVYYEGGDDHDKRMRLLDIGSKDTVWDHIYYRVDDEIRTLMSGQVVLRGLLGPEMEAYVATNRKYPVIPLHTADYSRDVLDPNESVCPRLTEIRTRNEASPGFQVLNKSAEAILLRSFQREVLKTPRNDVDMHAIDCLMTTMCTDRKLPAAIDDYSSRINNTEWSADYGNNLFQRLYEFETQMYVFNAKAENSEYSKVAMSALWYEVMIKIKAHTQRNADIQNRLTLIAGHDTTLIPMMATLGVWNDTEWPSYASMMLIELHEIDIDGNADRDIFRSDFAFRLIYNGVVVTQEIKGCPEDLELCDVSILDDFVLLLADCYRKHADPVQYQDAVIRTRDILSTTQEIIYLLLLVFGSATVGGIVMYAIVSRGTVPRSRVRYRSQEAVEHDESVNDGTGNMYKDDGDEYTERTLA